MAFAGTPGKHFRYSNIPQCATHVNVSFGPPEDGRPANTESPYAEGDILTRELTNTARTQLGLEKPLGKLAPPGQWFVGCSNLYTALSTFVGTLVASPPGDKVKSETFQSATFTGVVTVQNRSSRKWAAGQPLIVGPQYMADPGVALNTLYPCTTRHWCGDLVELCAIVLGGLNARVTDRIARIDRTHRDLTIELKSTYPQQPSASIQAAAGVCVQHYPWTILPVVVAYVLDGASDADVDNLYDRVIAGNIGANDFLRAERKQIALTYTELDAIANKIKVKVDKDAAERPKQISAFNAEVMQNGLPKHAIGDIDPSNLTDLKSFLALHALAGLYKRRVVCHKRAVALGSVGLNAYGQVMF